jgi:hypothetical protein
MANFNDPNFVNICQAVQIVTGYNINDLTKRNRSRKVLYPRQVIAYFLRSYYGYTFKGIGQLFNQHHTNIMHSIDSIECMISINDPIITDLITKINSELINLGHFKGHKKLVMYVPIQTDIERLKTLLIEKFNVSFNMF